VIGTRRYPVGQAIADAAQAVEDTAKIIAPVSAKGSPLSPPGTLKARTRVSEGRHHDPVTGYVLGLVGSPRYPYNFVANPSSKKGYTFNRGRRSTRWADDRLLEFATRSAQPFATFRV